LSKDWYNELKNGRSEKDAFFRTSHDSPIVHEEQESFKGLKYFEPDPKYSLKLKLQKYAKPEIVTLVTSTGTKQEFLRVGHFDFEIDGMKASLQAYRSVEKEDHGLFIPFKDETSGKESYGSARYIELGLSKNDQYFLDFNFAYNPYCAYSNDYVCPFAPKENWLDIEIRAGEKKYHD
jgi:uncharacterized protein (DUF1684 family)